MTHCPWKTYSQLRVTPLAPLPETIKQVRGTTGQGDSRSILPFCGIKSILSVLLNCSKQRNKVGAVLLKLPSKYGQMTPKEAVVCDLCPSHKQLTRLQCTQQCLGLRHPRQKLESSRSWGLQLFAVNSPSKMPVFLIPQLPLTSRSSVCH